MALTTSYLVLILRANYFFEDFVSDFVEIWKKVTSCTLYPPLQVFFFMVRPECPFSVYFVVFLDIFDVIKVKLKPLIVSV